MKDYCTQNNGDCSTCSLVSYGRDCLNFPLEEEKEWFSVEDESDADV